MNNEIAKKLELAKRVRLGDSQYAYAQLLLSGSRVVKDEIVGASHLHYFDCGCIRTLTVWSNHSEETLHACVEHVPLEQRMTKRLMR